MNTMHVFQEESLNDQRLHLDNWFRDTAENRPNKVICRCGGIRYDLSPNLIAVWHVKRWRSLDE